MSKHFVRFANRVAEASGYPSVFAVAVSMVLVWLATGPMFRFSDTGQLIPPGTSERSDRCRLTWGLKRMIKTFTGLTMAAAMAFTVGGALAQQAGGGPQPQLGTSTPNTQEGTTRPQTVPQPGSPGTQSGSTQQPTTGGQGNNAISTEKK
jgi:Low affinity iron permease